MPFERLSEMNRPRHVVDQILSSISDGTLAPGERLPSEAKLAELTGVGRTSVREALAALRLMGVVETKVGDGTYVRPDSDLATVSDRIASTIASSQEAVQLQEARAVFETGLVRLAVARWTGGKADAFQRLLSDMALCAENKSYEDYVRLHREFHLKLARATDNTIVEQTEQSFLEFMDHEGWQDMERQFYLPDRADYLRESLAEHRGIIDAISAEAQLAADLMHDHFSRHEGGNGA